MGLDEVPLFRREWLESCSWHHPGWQEMRWNHTTARALIASHFPDFLRIYDGYEVPVMRADAARILILAVHGGVYLDADIECLRNGEDMLAGRDVVLQMGGCTRAPPYWHEWMHRGHHLTCIPAWGLYGGSSVRAQEPPPTLPWTTRKAQMCCGC